MGSVTINSDFEKPSFKGNFLESQPNAKFWAGERHYRRQHIDIDDFYFLDMSGYGAGVEDWNLGIGKLAVAFVSAVWPDIVTQNGNLVETGFREDLEPPNQARPRKELNVVVN
jgi:maltoporin